MLLITGYGSIGSLVAKKYREQSGGSLVVIDKDEKAIHQARIDFGYEITAIVGDVSNSSDLKMISKWLHPGTKVVHTAAMKHVTFCEVNPTLAVTNNIIGIRNLLDVCNDNDVQMFVNVSTDKSAYPANVMGATKFIAERSVLAYGKWGYRNVRLGNVLFSTGSLFPTIEEIITNCAPLTITDLAATRFYISKDEVAEFILRAFDLPGQVVIKKLKSATLETMVNAAFELHDCPGYPYQITGLRQGEKLHEHLFTDVESGHITDHGDYWSIDYNNPTGNYIPAIDSSDPSCVVNYDDFMKDLIKADI